MNDNNLRKSERRTVECELRIREQAPGSAQEGQSRTIEGTAIVFNAESELLDDWGTPFREVIAPEACTMEFLNSQDVKMNLLHEREYTIARCAYGDPNASLRMSVDERGVHFEFEAPECDLGDRALALIRSGVYTGCSFEFWPQDYDREETNGEIKITHRKFRALEALTIGMDPAYRQTSVNARELYEQTPRGIAERKERERLAREEQKKAKQAADMRRRQLENMKREIDNNTNL